MRTYICLKSFWFSIIYFPLTGTFNRCHPIHPIAFYSRKPPHFWYAELDAWLYIYIYKNTHGHPSKMLDISLVLFGAGWYTKWYGYITLFYVKFSKFVKVYIRRYRIDKVWGVGLVEFHIYFYIRYGSTFTSLNVYTYIFSYSLHLYM